eukprot:TRINITY_DN20273_c0_g1_i2.p1 TRINITY_DN20273_c0_g1~~TRINITY_DN20273_c0_g1_i2.p1  ORF type:complete len:462 (+),score=162.31 TRINITY_DN20273_c0_g1_i2:150-1535(+)
MLRSLVGSEMCIRDRLETVTFDPQPEADNYVGLVLDSTAFYYESGGQVSDNGTISVEGAGQFRVLEAKKFGAYILHMGNMLSGSVGVHQEANLDVNYHRRLETAKNHTGTHLLNWALRQVLPNDADQEGSLCLPEKLRFDFSCPKAMKPDEIAKVEQFVNGAVEAALPVECQEAEQVKAREISVLRTMFNEQYPDTVRVVCVGKPVNDLLADPSNKDWSGFSVEFCGGTHLSNSSQIGDFVIVKEESVKKGTRRIEAVTGEYAQNARDASEELNRLVLELSSLGEADRLVEIKSLETRLVQTVLGAGDRAQIEGLLKAEYKKVLDWQKAQQKQANDKAVADAEQLAERLKGGAQRATVLELDGDKAILQNVIKAFHKIAPEIAIMTVGKNATANTLTVICETPKELQDALPAKDWCSEAVAVAGGKGGGKADRAQGAAKEACDKVEAVCEAAVMFANNRLN